MQFNRSNRPEKYHIFGDIQVVTNTVGGQYSINHIKKKQYEKEPLLPIIAH
jgi:hypothetical protein